MLTTLLLAALAAPASADRGAAVTFVSPGGEWTNVWVDGQPLVELRSFSTEATLALSPGVHHVEVRDFMDLETWEVGWLVLRPGQALTVAVDEAEGVFVYQDPSAFSLAPPQVVGTGPRRHQPGPRTAAVDRPVRVHLSAPDGAWANVRIDGRLVAELRGSGDAETLSLAPGVYTVEVRDFMDREVWTRGELVVGGTSLLRIGVRDEADLLVYNDPGAWR